jgi:1-acyl-sn-glycerol-3-phosphate acyltransferase
MNFLEYIKFIFKKIYYNGRYIYGLIYCLIFILFYSKFDYEKFAKNIIELVFSFSEVQYIDREKIEYIRKENKEGRGVLLFMNHYSGLDILFLVGIIEFYSVVKSDLLGEIINEDGSWVISYIKEEAFERLQFIPYKRGDKKSGDEVKDIILKNVKTGKNVIVFPEGTTQHCFKKPLEFKKGIFHLAFEHKIPIFSFSINYSKDIGFNKEEPTDFVHVMTEHPDVRLYCNGMFYPEYYDNLDELFNDVYWSISENTLLEWNT